MSGLVSLIQFLYYAFYPSLFIKSGGEILTRSKIQRFHPKRIADNKHLDTCYLKQTFADTLSKAGSTMHCLPIQCQLIPGIVNYSFNRIC